MKKSILFIAVFLLAGCVASEKAKDLDTETSPIEKIDIETLVDLTKDKVSIQVLSRLSNVTANDVDVTQICSAEQEGSELEGVFLVHWEVKEEGQDGVYVYKEEQNQLELGSTSYDTGNQCIDY
ncbi:hypothetical protein J26TS2_44860 [Shouchella clausii]|nr:hypothetical protein J26TS2_44860 [Shouchella clausii]